MVGPKSIQGWIDTYEERTGEKFVYKRGFDYLWDPMNGFFSYKLDPDEMVIVAGPTCGNAKYWKQKIWELFYSIQHKGYKGIVCYTQRNPEAYERFCSGKLIRKEVITDYVKGTEETIYFFFTAPDDVKEVDRYRKPEL
jgi:hypothetical protein